MIFETIYAYLQNINFASMFMQILLTILLILLGIFRYINSVDKDDWVYLMIFTVPLWLLFSFLSLAPGLEHIKQVHDALNKIERPIDNLPQPAVQLSNTPQVGVNQKEN